MMEGMIMGMIEIMGEEEVGVGKIEEMEMMKTTPIFFPTAAVMRKRWMMTSSSIRHRTTFQMMVTAMPIKNTGVYPITWVDLLEEVPITFVMTVMKTTLM